jgi:hypothetical protein
VARCKIVWATHPRHLPEAPSGKVAVVDVAFAAGNQFKSKTKPMIDKLGERLVRWVDHHEHRVASPLYQDDARFLLVPNKSAHACPELITKAVVEESEQARGVVDTLVAHCDFDGAIAAVKWCRGGREPWPGADEDARAVDSPGRGHVLSAQGARVAGAMDEASARFERKEQLDFMTRCFLALVEGEEPLGLASQIDELAAAARLAEESAREIAQHGKEEAPGVFVVRVPTKVDNRVRRNLLLEAEARAPIGALFEPDPAGGAWLTAATFDEALDLEDVPGFEGGRSDYRFARVEKGGHDAVVALGAYFASKRGTP